MSVERNAAETGRSRDRADARLKVTGTAQFSADFSAPRMAYAVFVGSTIAKGRVADVDLTAAVAAGGVIQVLTSENAMRVAMPADIFDPTKKQPPKPNEVTTNTASSVLPLQSDRIHFRGQIIAAVVAESFEQAQAAAALVTVEYETEKPSISLRLNLDSARTPESFLGEPITVVDGDPESALAHSPVRIDETYYTPIENHHAMEMQSTTAEWRGDELFVEETTRYVQGVKRNLAQSFGIPDDKVHVRAKFVGGAFGSKGAVRPHVTLAAMCARQTGRPVKFLLTRRQVTYTSGHRPETLQRVALGADKDGRLTAIIHDGFSSCSATDPFIEAFTRLSGELYAAPSRALTQKIVYLDEPQPTNMRGPGETSGMYALESAMDELADELGMDPLALRRINEPTSEPITGKSYSNRLLLECIDRGAEAFGWEKRHQTPRSVREGNLLIGYGYATATYPLKGSPCQARCRISDRGEILVQSSTHDFGNGIATSARQIAADSLGVTYDDVTFEYADSDLPPAMQTGGSTTTMWVGSAIKDACEQARADLGDLPRGSGPSEFAAILRSSGRAHVEATAEASPNKELMKQYSMNSFGAHFCEVAVDADLGVTRVRRFLSVMNCGRIVNPKLARSQYIGAVTMGTGMALTEGNAIDPRNGMWIQADLADYHLPVYADTDEMDVIWLEEPDLIANPLGAKGLGEMGLVGTAAAIANAVFNATGKRVRELPITPEKLL